MTYSMHGLPIGNKGEAAEKPNLQLDHVYVSAFSSLSGPILPRFRWNLESPAIRQGSSCNLFASIREVAATETPSEAVGS